MEVSAIVTDNSTNNFVVLIFSYGRVDVTVLRVFSPDK